MFGLCTDSTAQLPPEWTQRYAVETVPLTVTIGDDEFLDGIDLSPDDWFARLAADGGLDVDVAAPSPGQFALAFEDLLRHGCTGIVSLHAAVPADDRAGPLTCAGSVRAARLAAHRLEVPVRVLELPVAGFALGCSVWAAAEALAAGADLDAVVAVAEDAARRASQLVITAPLEVLQRGSSADDRAEIAVHEVCWDGETTRIREVRRTATVLDAVNTVTAAAVGAAAAGARLAVGHGDSSTEPIALAIETSLGESAAVESVMRTRVGPTSSRFTGGGVVRCSIVPADLFPPPVSRPDPPTAPGPSTPATS